jgi:hypothetical protein
VVVAGCAAPPAATPRVETATRVEIEAAPTVAESLAMVEAAQDAMPKPVPRPAPTLTFDTMRALVKRCYVDGLKRNPDLRGKVIVRAIVDEDGAVERAEDAGSTLPDKTTIACVVETVSHVEFAPMVSGGTTIIVPFTFVPPR